MKKCLLFEYHAVFLIKKIKIPIIAIVNLNLNCRYETVYANSYFSNTFEKKKNPNTKWLKKT